MRVSMYVWRVRASAHEDKLLGSLLGPEEEGQGGEWQTAEERGKRPHHSTPPPVRTPRLSCLLLSGV